MITSICKGRQQKKIRFFEMRLIKEVIFSVKALKKFAEPTILTKNSSDNRFANKLKHNLIRQQTLQAKSINSTVSLDKQAISKWKN
jgi:hypothetical protein